MKVREYTDADFDRIKQLHELSGFDYPIPNLSSAGFFSRRVCGGDADSFGMASFLRLTAEAFLFCDPSWRTPAWRMEALRQLHYSCNADAKAAGVKEVVAFLPPQITRNFGRRLKRMGWTFHKDEEWRAFGHSVD